MKLESLAKKYNYTCYWCRQKFPLEDLSRDHIIPLNKGRGSHRKRTGWGNCVLSCIVCNADRGNMPFDWYKKIRHGKKIKSI